MGILRHLLPFLVQSRHSAKWVTFISNESTTFVGAVWQTSGIWVQINPEIQIQISSHFWLRLDALGEVCILWEQSSTCSCYSLAWLWCLFNVQVRSDDSGIPLRQGTSRVWDLTVMKFPRIMTFWSIASVQNHLWCWHYPTSQLNFPSIKLWLCDFQVLVYTDCTPTLFLQYIFKLLSRADDCGNFFSLLALLLLAASGAYSIGDWCLDGLPVVTLFSNRCSSYSFCSIFTKLGRHDLCPNVQKSVVQIFEILILKFLANFKNFT